MKTLNDNLLKLNIELSSFSAEMREFKASIIKQLAELEKHKHHCQENPASCANARRLDEYIAMDKSRLGRTTGLIGCALSSASMLFTLITVFAGK